MPITETIIEDVLYGVVEDTSIAITQEVNRLQIAVDRYVAQQGASMTVEGLRAAIFGGESTVISSEMSVLQRYIMRALNGAVNDSMGRGQVARLEERPADVLYTWRAESAKPCPDCSARNGEQRYLDEWQAAGLPRSGFSICNKNCKCVIDSTGTGNFNRSKKGD
jgi:hypothetical protein